MKRRDFVKAAAVPPVAGAAVSGEARAIEGGAEPDRVPGQVPFEDYRDEGFRGPRTLLFFDYYPLMRFKEMRIRQATAEYVPGSEFIDPHLGENGYENPASQPFFDEARGLWIRLQGYPDMYAYESEDAIHWKPSPRPEAKPRGGQKHPHHVYRAVEHGFGSSLLYDPDAKDGFPYKFLILEGHGTTYRETLKNPESFWYPHALEAQKKGGAKHFHARGHAMLVSEDGLNWDLRRDFDWGKPPLITEEHYTLFYNHHYGEYSAVHRARWGDRRLFLSTSPDAREWDGPHLMLHPDVLDEGRIEFHGSAIGRYDSFYIGLLWYGNYTNSRTPAWTGGPDTTHLIYSYDGHHFQRVRREGLIPLKQPGQPWFRGFWSRGFIQKDDSILLYSDTWGFDHEALDAFGEQEAVKDRNEAMKRLRTSPTSRPFVAHRLRKDGFTWLEPVGEWGECQTVWIMLHDEKVTINADALAGEIHYEVGLVGGRDVVAEGFSYEDCVPMTHRDSTAFELRFEGKSLAALVGTPIYLRFRVKRARLYSLRADFSTDPTQRYRAEKGMPLHNTSWLF